MASIVMGKTLKKYQILILASTICLMSTSQTVGKYTGSSPDSLRLNDKQRVGEMYLSAETIRKAPHTLLIPITRIRNQNKIPLMIRIKMTWGDHDSSNKKVIGIGNLNLFPPAQVGIYSRQISDVFKYVNILGEEIEKNEKEAALVFEITPVYEKENLEEVEVVIDPVRWRTKQRRPISEN